LPPSFPPPQCPSHYTPETEYTIAN
jgi:hypothetical protein